MSQANQVTICTASKVLDKDTFQITQTVQIGLAKPSYTTWLIDRKAMMHLKQLSGSSAQRLEQLMQSQQAETETRVNETIAHLLGNRGKD